MDKGTKKGYAGQHKLEFVRGGKEYFRYLQHIIDTAKYAIHIQMYIFSYDDIGRTVLQWLKNAAARKVKIYMLLDGYATQDLPEALLKDIRSSTIYIERYEPLFKTKSLYIGRRLHHKIVVADGWCALTGSGNINNHYNGFGNNNPWLDLALYVEGSVARDLEHICIAQWDRVGTTGRKVIPECAPVIHAGLPPGNAISVKVSRNDWMHNRQEIWKSYFNLLNKATKNIYLVSSYFLPGRRLRKQMARASRKGVIIKVVTAGVSDVALAKHAERYLYRWMMANNIEIYEYQRSVLHAKIGIRDGKWLTLGSFNINNISTYAGIELNLDVRNRPFVQSVQHEVDTIIRKDCIRITTQTHKRYDTTIHRLIQWLCYNMIRTLLYLFTFYFRRKTRNGENLRR